MDEIKYTAPPQSRNEAILAATIDGDIYEAPPQSRIEDLLLQLKEVIESSGGGGSGGTTNYNLLSNKPQIGGVTLQGNKTLVDLGIAATADLAPVATTGAYSDLSGTPDLAAVATSGKYSDLSGKPNLATVATSGQYADLIGTPNLATVATSGAYSDLTGKPTIDTEISSTSMHAVQNKAISAALATKASAADLTAETTARETADATQFAVLSELIDGGAKNEINLFKLTQSTIGGITWTLDPVNGTVTANGTATTNSFFYLWANGTDAQYDEPTVLSGAPEGGSSTTYELQTAIGSTVYHDYGGGVNIPAGTVRYIACCVRNGTTVSDLVFRPMFCTAAKWSISQAFVPYCPDVVTIAQQYVLTDMPVSAYVENLAGYNSGYYKDVNGVVHINAVFKALSNITGGSIITTLPTGYRPPKNCIMYGINVATREMISIDMGTNGQCAVYGTISSGNNIAFSGEFPTAAQPAAVAAMLNMNSLNSAGETPDIIERGVDA